MITNKNKIILGKLFKKYKEEKNITIIQIEQENISSLNTFYNACKGEVIKNDKFYIDYCNFFNYPYKEDTTIDLWLSDFISRLLHVFDYYEENKFDCLYEEFNLKMNPYKEYAIYHEYYQVIHSLFNYYRKNEYLKLEQLEECLNLIDINLLPRELNIYLLDYLFRTNWNYIGNKELPNIIVRKMEEIDETHYLTNYQKGFLLKFNCDYIASLNCFNQCMNNSKDKNNKYRKVQSLLAIYSIYRNIDNSMEEKTANELLAYKEESNLPNSLMHNINYNVGMQDYLEGRYERAYELFNENLIEYQSYFTLLFQCSICSRLKLEYPKELFSKVIEDRYDFIYLDYFRKKMNRDDNKKLANYVLNTIIPKKMKVEVYKNPYWSLFEYEMYDMANKDIKLRKYYVNFMKELKKYCKDS